MPLNDRVRPGTTLPGGAPGGFDLYTTEQVLPLALRMLRDKQGYEGYERYYLGIHRLAYASEKWRNVFGRLFGKFADNLCPAVVDALADRLEISGFTIRGNEEMDETNDENIKRVEQVWHDNQMDHNAGHVHSLCLRDGDTYVLVWPDIRTGEPVITPQLARMTRVKYDPEKPGRIQWATKSWINEEKRCRVNLYFPDRIEKFITPRKMETVPERAGNLVAYDEKMGNKDDKAWPIPNPYGICPIFHFGNNCVTGNYGQSELRDVLPLQDAINKSILDLLAAMEYTALPQRWATGLEVEIDEETGRPIPPFTPGVDQLWATPATDIKFGEFSQGNLNQLVAVTDSLRMEVARITGTPLHYFMLMTDPPSGEALKALEARLLKKVRDRQLSYGAVWDNVIQFCNVILGGSWDVKFHTRWKDPAPRDEFQFAQALLIKSQLGVPRDQILSECGYTDEEIEEFKQMRNEEAASVGTQMLHQMAAGGLLQKQGKLQSNQMTKTGEKTTPQQEAAAKLQATSYPVPATVSTGGGNGY